MVASVSSAVEVSLQLRVTSVRASGQYGGAIFAGMTEKNEYFVAVCSNKVVRDPSLVWMGQTWLIRGTLRRWNDEDQIAATAAEMLVPSGENIIGWMVRECPGIGPASASKLYTRFGPALVEYIKNQDLAVLAEVIGAEAADLMCHIFEKHNVAGTLLWLDRLAIPQRIGRKIADFYKYKAKERIENNPYLLISFDGAWEKVDQLAQCRFGIQPDDARRLEAAIEHVLYEAMSDGHTCLPVNKVQARLHSLLGHRELAKRAIEFAGDSTQYSRVDDVLQPTGAFIIEKYVADRLHSLANAEVTGQQSLLQSSGDGVAADIIADYESKQGFPLTDEQRDAVMLSAKSSLSLILGGAGTGKTTVLKVLYDVLEKTEQAAIYQVALAGRAAQRMTEATGRPSMTIAGFLKNFPEDSLGHGTVVVVDEMSMVDVILMYRLLRFIPPGTKLVLVGDPAQLPPIGPGLVLHALAGHPAIPQTELKVTKRQSAESGIPSVAAAIRSHAVPQFAPYAGKGSGVSFVACETTESTMNETMRRIYRELGGDATDYRVGVLSTTRTGAGGSQWLNNAFHDEYHADSPVFYMYDKQFGAVAAQSLERCALRVGDLVLFTENDYDLGLRNGSLGIVVKGSDTVTKSEDISCVCDFDGKRYELNSRQVESLRHAYAITVHKSQGSQFARVIVPLRKSRLLDQALIYTAVTRGVEQVVLVGDRDAALAAIQAPASATRRFVSLPSLLRTAVPHTVV
jgi:exodeoxyribonuclease V alpha subunit